MPKTKLDQCWTIPKKWYVFILLSRLVTIFTFHLILQVQGSPALNLAVTAMLWAHMWGWTDFDRIPLQSVGCNIPYSYLYVHVIGNCTLKFLCKLCFRSANRAHAFTRPQALLLSTLPTRKGSPTSTPLAPLSTSLSTNEKLIKRP